MRKAVHKYARSKFSSKKKNWSFYNKALVNRGDISLYLSEEVLRQWYWKEDHPKGGSYVYSSVCMESMLFFKSLFNLAYRQTEGFTKGLLKLMGEELKVPSYSQLSRRAKTMEVQAYKIPKQGSIHIAIDSTGLKVYGEGEWKVRKHGYSKRRTWRKLHLGVDPQTGYIHAHSLTDNKTSDSSQFQPLLEQIEAKVKEVSADGAYDTWDCWEQLEIMGIYGLIPPRINANYWIDEQGNLLEHRRNEILDMIDRLGEKEWKLRDDYHLRSLSETAMFRFKTIFGAQLYSRTTTCQKNELAIKIKLLNIMTNLGMPCSPNKAVA